MKLFSRICRISLHNGGISLFDLLCATALAGMLFSSAWFYLKSPRRDYNLRTEAYKLKAILQTLALKAKEEEREILFELSPESYAAKDEVTEATIISHSFKPPVTALNAQGIKRIRFSPSGVTSPQSLILLTPWRRCTITISLRGRVRCVC